MRQAFQLAHFSKMMPVEHQPTAQGDINFELGRTKRNRVDGDRSRFDASWLQHIYNSIFSILL